MVCKRDEVLTWFKGLKSYKRTDLMCNLLNLCLPFELRFLGTCLEHLGKRDFHELRQSENEANSLSELNALDLQCLSNQQVRTKLAVYVSLLYSCNYTCSNSIFNILTKSDDIHTLLKTSGDDTILDDLLLIFTLAINHPAFSFEQKLSLEKIFSQLLEEDRLFMQSNGRNSKSFTATTMEPIHDKSPQLQGYSACIPLEDAHIIGVPSPSQLPMAQPAAHHPGEANAGVGVIGVHDGANGGLRLSYSVPPGNGNSGGGGGQGPPLLINPWAIMTPVAATMPSGADSPIGASRTSSPCNSASRPGSPHQQTLPHQPSPAQQSQPQQQQSQQQQQQQQQRLKFPPSRVPPPQSAVGPDHLREAIGKEMPKYITNLQNYSNEQLSRMSDEDLREIGLNQNAIIQLRSILNKQVMTNGIGPTPQIIDMSNVKKKVDQPIEHEYGSIPTVVHRYPMDMAVYPGGMMGPPMSQCYSCYIAPRKCLSLPHYQVAAPLQPPPPQPHHHLSPVAPTAATILTDPLRSLRLDTEPSSASDTASDHSPPDTPAPTSHLTGASIGGDALAGGDERLGGGGNEERRSGGAPHGRARGIGRNRINPPGIQKLPRGRGPNPVQRRREVGANMCNGGIVEDRKMYSSNSGNGSNGGSNNGNSNTSSGGNNTGGGGSEPPTPTGGYFTSYMSPYIRPAGYPSFHHPGFVRPTYPPPAYHNGDIVYPYPPPPPPQGNGPQGPPQFLPGPPQPPYSPAPPPAPPQLPPPQQQHKLSCYNCGNQSHVAIDCPEATIEEITKQGQYKIDFTTTYQKQPGEVPSSGDK